MDGTEIKLKNLDYIQETINRMASNSFQLKTWTVGLTTGISFFGEGQTTDFRLLILKLGPIVVFCFLDAYYLNNERKYRSLFNYIKDQEFENRSMEMNVSILKTKESYFKAFFSPSIWLFYFVLISFYILLFCYQ